MAIIIVRLIYHIQIILVGAFLNVKTQESKYVLLIVAVTIYSNRNLNLFYDDPKLNLIICTA